MRVILVRHGKASKDPTIATDAERPLTDRGREDIAGIGRLLVNGGITVTQIRHSGLLRAQQTAEILGSFLTPPQGVSAVRGLHYVDPVEPLAQELHYETEPVMLVGHNPFMERLVAALLTVSGRTPVRFATSTTACLHYVEGEWSLKWVLHRELVG